MTNLPCGCPVGMKYHADNCRRFPGDEQQPTDAVLYVSRFGVLERIERDSVEEAAVSAIYQVEHNESYPHYLTVRGRGFVEPIFGDQLAHLMDNYRDVYEATFG